MVMIQNNKHQMYRGQSIHSDPVDNVESSATEVTTSAPLPASDENDATQPTTDNADDLDEFFDSL
jgi:hypothetical protein